MLLDWRPTLTTALGDVAIVVDYETGLELQVRKAIASFGEIGVLRWDGPSRSPGSGLS